MKNPIVEQAIGDKGKVGVYVGDGVIELAANAAVGDANVQFAVDYPIAKAADPVNKLIDSAFDKIEAIVPGDWDKALLEPIRAEAKAEFLKLIGG